MILFYIGFNTLRTNNSADVQEVSMLKTYYLNTTTLDTGEHELHVAECEELSTTVQPRELGVYFDVESAVNAANIMGYDCVVCCKCCGE